MPKAYDSSATEGRIYESWVEGGYFTPEIDRSKEPFTVIMPPPNVTGELHYGHALTIALEDLMCRWHRMKGDPTLYLPGTDHAGIATQVVVERMLANDDLTRHDLGRREFVATVWRWVDQYGDRIYEQIKRLGASCDWSRQAFTLDQGPSKAVRTTFVNLYEKGLIYRGERIVNWCPRCATALSDLEVKHEDKAASLYHIRYDLSDGSDALTIATTRPETLLGDTAVAVNPDDERYSEHVGKSAVLPVLGRVIPVIADSAVDPSFGTGALKVTPGHDHNDFDIRERQDIDLINAMNLDGTMNENAGPYEGMDRYETRTRIVAQLEREGLLEKVEPMHHALGHCDRCSEIVEPLVTNQWYMKMEPLAKPAIEAVEDGRVGMVPERFSKVYFNWMYNIRDWCISRQLWWGHRIPAWYCDACDHTTVALEDPDSCSGCGSMRIERDPDVLDTWFSSALWPHSTLGWPDRTEDLDYFYPSTVMETGHDILFFWVARMMMMGMENAGDIPFQTVYLHGLVRDPEGAKMSKSKGNVKDPLDLIDAYGADALRFALTTGTSPGNDMRLTDAKITSSRNFANKLWNASRFVVANLDRSGVRPSWERPETSHVEDRWIVSRLNRVTASVDSYMDEFQFGEAQREVHDFLWNEYCDWYLEMSKVRMRAGDESPIPVLAYVLERVLRLLHPFLPFITEEIWQNLVQYMDGEADSPALMVAEYPVPEIDAYDESAEAEIGAVVEVVHQIRNALAKDKAYSGAVNATLIPTPEVEAVFETETMAIKHLAKVEPELVRHSDSLQHWNDIVTIVHPMCRVTLRYPEQMDSSEANRLRLTSDMASLEVRISRLEVRLQDERFLTRAPAKVVETERARLASAQKEHDIIKGVLDSWEANSTESMEE